MISKKNKFVDTLMFFLVLLLIFLIAGMCLASPTEYYMFIAVDSKKDTGQYKKGDIIQILPSEKYKPTEGEKSRFGIIKVSGLTEEDISKYCQPYIENERTENEKIIAYRKWEVDVDKLGINKGVDTDVKTHDSIKNDIKDKSSFGVHK